MRVSLRMQGPAFGAGIIVAALLFLAAAGVADELEPVAQIVHADRQPARVGDDDQAQVIPLARGKRGYLGQFSLIEGATMKRQVGDGEEFLYVLAGSAVLTINEQTYFVGPRMGVYLPPEATVEWVNGSQRLQALQFLVGTSPGARFESWRRDDSAPNWPRPRYRPRPPPSSISGDLP